MSIGEGSMNLKSVSKYMSLVLRHKPGNLKLSEGGWVDIDDFIRETGISFVDVMSVVRKDEKGRYSYDLMGRRIRANQGHSVSVDMGFVEKMPPAILYHGTTNKVEDFIFKDGLKKMTRQYVHLSRDVDTARVVAGRRSGSVIILEVNSGQMYSDGYKFYESENGVWLVDSVPVSYLRKVVP